MRGSVVVVSWAAVAVGGWQLLAAVVNLIVGSPEGSITSHHITFYQSYSYQADRPMNEYNLY